MRPVRDDTLQAGAARRGPRRIGVPAIFGAVIVKRVPDDREYVLYNTAVASDTAGTITSRYDKQYLLTFGEYLPLRRAVPRALQVVAQQRALLAGHVARPAPARRRAATTHPVSMLICYEDILPEFTNEAVRHADPELLVNMTNDAWFGDTVEPWEHLALAQLRAVEHRRYLVRGTNSGVSAIVDPVGRVIAHTGTFRQEAISAPIHWMRSHTVYERIGDWPWLLGTIALGIGAFRKRKLS